jgi:GAF domain-containing protein
MALACVAFVLLAAAAFFATYRRRWRHSLLLQRLFIGGDVVLISFFYASTDYPQSLFFLFYCLPIFSATEYLTGGALLATLMAVLAAFAAVLVWLTVSGGGPAISPMFLRVLAGILPRAVFFFGVIITASYLSRFERLQMRSLLDLMRDMDELLGIDQVLSLAITEALKSTGAETGAVVFLDSSSPHGYRVLAPGGRFEEFGLQPVIELITGEMVRAGRIPRRRELRSAAGSLRPSLICVPLAAHGIVRGALLAASTSRYLGEEAEAFLHALAEHAASAVERIRLRDTIGEVGSVTTAGTTKLNSVIEAILHELSQMGFQLATVSLVDDYLGTIETVRGQNVPRGWIRRSRHSLAGTDIQADVVKSGKTEVIEGWDDRFDKAIYDIFEHWRYIRIFAPLVAGDTVVGTIEAGCNKELKPTVVSAQAVQGVTELGRVKGMEIAACRPHVVLERIARNAIDVMGADSASLHFYRGGELLRLAGAGRADQEFLHEFLPSAGGVGEQAMQSREPVTLDDSEELRRRNPRLYDRGVRAMAAFPLSIGEGMRGVLYLHFWKEGARFSPAHKELGKLFARQMEIALQNDMLLRQVSEEAQTAWALSDFHNVLFALASSQNPDPRAVLEQIARHVLHAFDADLVTLYQYFAEDKRFEAQSPVMAGSFTHPDAMAGKTNPDDIQWHLVETGRSQFITDVSPEEFLPEDGKDSAWRLKFFTREGIKSCAMAVLRAGVVGEVVGVMFINYRTPRRFGGEDRKAIQAAAASAAIAIQTARLHARATSGIARRFKDQLSALLDLIRLIVTNSSMDSLERLVEAILKTAQELTAAPAGDILWFDPSTQRLMPKAQYPEGPWSRPHSLDEGIVGMAARTRLSQLVPDVKLEKSYYEALPSTRSELAVPIIDGRELLGVINLEHPQPDAFKADDQTLTEILAAEAVLAFHSFQLLQDIRQQVQPLKALNEIAARIRAHHA